MKLSMRLGVSANDLSADVVAPSELGPTEIGRWHALMDGNPALRSAFLSPEFAAACEQVYGRVRVAILHRGGDVVAFFPFQFADLPAQTLKLAQRIGEEMSDAAGIVAPAGFVVSSPALMRLCRLSAMFISHVHESQSDFGLACNDGAVSPTVDLSAGADAYFCERKKTRSKFVSNALRLHRSLHRKYGSVEFTFAAVIDSHNLDTLIDLKRAQYRRTEVPDVFGRPERRALIERLVATPSPYCAPVLNLVAIAGEPAGYHLGLRCGSTLGYWFPAYETRWAAASPGRVLLWKLVEEARANGIDFIDLGAGDGQVKRQFANGAYKAGKAVWTSGGLAGLAARSYLSLQWRLSPSRANQRDGDGEKNNGEENAPDAQEKSPIERANATQGPAST